jgi:DNA polymerase-3 subunit delta'
VKLEHPDLHWYFPLSRPKGVSTPDKLAQALEEARGEVLSELRENPLRASVGGEPKSLYLAAARTLRRQAHRRPSSGERQVFLIAEAEALAPQESSSEAANALLKLLEEPPSGTVLILTSSEPGRLLPTIRSRTTQLHLPPLSREEVSDFLVRVAQVEEGEAHRAAAISHGAIGRALGFVGDGHDPGPLEETRKAALRLLSAALAPTLGPAFQVAGSFQPVGARGLFELLDFLEEWLRDLAVATCQPREGRGGQWDAEVFEEVLARWSIHPSSVTRAIQATDAAREMAAGNVNPQLLIFGLLRDLREELVGQPHGTGSRRHHGQTK